VCEQEGRRVALKALSLRGSRDWKAIELFEREARVLSQLEHPSIPNYIDYFEVPLSHALPAARARCKHLPAHSLPAPPPRELRGLRVPTGPHRAC
jgi:serine/threonine protein kinase